MRAERGADAGFVTITYLLVVCLSMLVFVWLANVIVLQYVRGVVRAALDDAARVGARHYGDADPALGEQRCEERAEDVRVGLLRGPMGRGLIFTCAQEGVVMVAEARGRVESWFPGIVPDWDVDLGARVVKETAP